MKPNAVRTLRAEWTKLRSVRSTPLALLAMLALILLMTVSSASGSSANYSGPKSFDSGTFVHRTTTTADGTYTARVAAQKNTVPWAKAGLLLKDGTGRGASYVALVVTPGHGIRMMADNAHELSAAADTGAPVRLRLTRAGNRVSGAYSADGRTWHRVGTLTPSHLPASAQAGLFVTSPDREVVKRTGPHESVSHPVRTVGRATFDHVTMESAHGGWTRTKIEPPAVRGAPGTGTPTPRAPTSTPFRPAAATGTFTFTGSGDLGGLGMGGTGESARTDLVKMALDDAVPIATIAVIALGVLTITSEYRTGTLRTTFTASPRRGRVLAAKATVLGATVFVVALAAMAAAFLLARPYQRRNGFRPPLYDNPSLTDPSSIRAVVGSAAFLALVAVLGLGVGALLRRTVPALVLMYALLVVVPLVATQVSIAVDTAVFTVTPVAGMSIQQTKRLAENAMTPWAGFAVLCLYVAVALAAARHRLVRRDT
ncbi:hypothetical protein ACN2WE_19745 [Streptomyces sp. cg28]|uniref:hypothetical protein n=1 Tax=Streptomyces sp. cg28 TaxID=3403457 RepID=UPI003B20D1FB